jgi:glutaconate CoA-transferase subunit A
VGARLVAAATLWAPAPYLAWDKVSESVEAIQQYLDEWVYGLKDRNEYWEKLGVETHRRLTVAQLMSQPINYGRY